MATEYTSLAPPDNCIVDFCIVPVGTGNPSVSTEIAIVTKLLEASGIKHETHATGTTIEGSFEEAMRVIGHAHTMLHKNGIVRIHTNVSISTRSDKNQTMKGRLESLEKNRQLAARKILP